MNKNEIQAKYLVQHDALGSRKDAEDKELFDLQHSQVWQNCDIELQERKVELEAKDTLTDAEKQELAELESMFPSPVEVAPPLVFTPPSGTGIPEKVEYIEQFLRGLYPEGGG